MQPLSCLKGDVRCGIKKCMNRSTLAAGHFKFTATFAAATLKIQCSQCRLERAARALVATNGNDRRFQEEKIVCAPAVCLQIIMLNMT